MSIVYSSRLVDIWRPPIGSDSYRPAQVQRAKVFDGVRAHLDRIPRITSSYDVTQGEEEQLDVHIVLDPTDVKHYDRVYDRLSTLWYDVIWVEQHINEVPTKFGGNFDYTECLLVIVQGES